MIAACHNAAIIASKCRYKVLKSTPAKEALFQLFSH